MNAHAHAFPRSMLQVLDDMPEDERWEVIDGGLYPQAPCFTQHNMARDGCVALLRGPYQSGLDGGSGDWWIIGKQRVIGPDPEQWIVEPDVAGWRRERMPRLQEPYIHVIPDWICEVLAPWTRERDLGMKKDSYAALGVPWYWIVDTDAQTIDVHALVDVEYQITHKIEAGKTMRLPPFMEVETDPSIVFF